MTISKKNGIIAILIIAFSIIVSINGSNKEYTLKELCQKSSEIVRVKVKEISSYYDNIADANRIYSDIILEIVKVYKGRLQETSDIKITMFGGTKDGYTMFALEAPQFQQDGESILFLRRNLPKEFGEEELYLIDWDYGKFDIKTDESNVKKYVFSDRLPFPLLIDSGKSSLDFKSHQVYLIQFEELIKNYI